MIKKIIISAVIGLIVYVLVFLVRLEQPNWFLQQCTEPDSCYQKIAIDGVNFYKTSFNNSVIIESSGLIASRTYPDTIWTHNDSGSFPFIYAVDQLGNLQGGSYIADTWATDWEDIASDDSGNLYVLDYVRTRKEQVVYVIPEPDPTGFTLSFTANKIYFSLPDVSKDKRGKINIKAEALFWSKGELYLLTRDAHRVTTDADRKRTVLYRFPEISSEKMVVLEPIASLDLSAETFDFGGNITAADITPDGKFLALLSYWAIYLFQFSAQDNLLLSQPVGPIVTRGRTAQAEGVTWRGDDLLISNEEGELFLIKDVLPIDWLNKQ